MQFIHHRRTGKRTGSGSNVPQHDLTLFDGARRKVGTVKYTDNHSAADVVARIVARLSKPDACAAVYPRDTMPDWLL